MKYTLSILSLLLFFASCDTVDAAAMAIGSYLGPNIWAGLNIAKARGVIYNINDCLNPGAPRGELKQERVTTLLLIDAIMNVS